MQFEVIAAPKATRKPKFAELVQAIGALDEGTAIKVSVKAGTGKRPGVSTITAIQAESRDAGFTARVLSVEPNGESEGEVFVTFSRADLRAAKGDGEANTEETPEQ